MHARLTLLTATAAALATSAFAAAPPSTTSSSSMPAAPAASAAPAAASAAAKPARASSAQHQQAGLPALYRRAQQKLTDLGLYSGPVDGHRNAAFVQSLERFQRDHHLQASGHLTSETQRALGIA